MKNYFELKISINPEIEDIVSDICFSNFDCEGIVLAEENWKDLEMTSTTRGILKVFLTELNCNPVEVLQTEREILKSRGFSDEELGSWEISLDEKENQDWSKKWKEKWDVTHVTNNIAVVPSWLNYEPKENEITITLDPGCAFGTGTHQTTQLCMKAIEKYLKKGDSMADIGTGSGILAICAKKFGAISAYGCDNDETVIDVCIENSRINNVECVFELNTADKLTEKYDFVCANILHNILAEIMGDLKNIMKQNAKMVLSGILDEKKAVVLEAIERENLKIIETAHQDQWVAIIVENN
ncbi:50S ribosomal protein L11 methyltransferase [bacterium]|nr:50S ribosomal protein L11 methyltransferase [bacterium]